MDYSLKDKFVDATSQYIPNEYTVAKAAKYLVIAVQLPSGAIELITNTEQIPSKIAYYLQAYDDEFRLKTNPVIQVVNFMIV